MVFQYLADVTKRMQDMIALGAGQRQTSDKTAVSGATEVMEITFDRRRIMNGASQLSTGRER
ncbi:MAG TPA: hypothetical protein VG096_17700 [Bryobacteraceae bacterium]|jgi:hypothetical protein|nr:hypothetical protein [Bryobacteraceae bacterium]